MEILLSPPILLPLIFIYFLPTVLSQHKRNRRAIVALNLVAGWTFVGWVVALVWAYLEEPASGAMTPKEAVAEKRQNDC